MPLVLLRPHLLAAKNRFRADPEHRSLGRDIVGGLILVIMVVSIYAAAHMFFLTLSGHPQFQPVLISHLVNMVMLAFFLLLLFSNSIAALGCFFMSSDLPLVLTAPVSLTRIYFARLAEVAISSSWMFLLLTLPALSGAYTALELHWSFLPIAALSLFPFILLPAVVGATCVIIFVNIVPPHRIKELLIFGAMLMVAGVLFVHYQERNIAQSSQQRMDELVKLLQATGDITPRWLPGAWLTAIIGYYFLPGSSLPLAPAALLFGLAGIFTIVGLLLFRALFMRGWGISLHVHRTLRIRNSRFGAVFGRLIIPFDQQLRAMCYKEVKMFLRDATQSLQMILLLMLTFVYLYNFRALRDGVQLHGEGLAWWRALLALANVAFGACVVSAIAARFVYPSVSLEGRAYSLIRSAPLSLRRLLRNKFFIWLVPISILSLVLLVSGTWAIYASAQTVLASAFLALAVSLGITGMAVGIGAVYARFDWESPVQVTASFGSLIYMLLSMGQIIVTMLPAIPLFFLTSVGTFSEQLTTMEYALVAGGSMLLIFYINYAAARQALAAGLQHLQDIES